MPAATPRSCSARSARAGRRAAAAAAAARAAIRASRGGRPGARRTSTTRRRRGPCTPCSAPPPGEQRQAVVAALVAERDPRVVPVLVRILNESDPLGSDHADRARDARRASAQVGDDHAVPHVAQVMRRRSWFARKKSARAQAGARSARCARSARRPRRSAIADAASTRRPAAAEARARGGGYGAWRP